MAAVWYLLPKTGSGGSLPVDPENLGDTEWIPDPIRPAYLDELREQFSGIHMERRLDDPFDYFTGASIWALVDPPVGAEAFLEQQVGVVRLGTSPATARQTIRAAVDIRSQAWNARFSRDDDLESVLALKSEQRAAQHGTDTTDFTDDDDTVWTSLSSNALSYQFISGTGGDDYSLKDVNSNQGLVAISGGANKEEKWHSYQTADNAEDCTITLTFVSSANHQDHHVGVAKVIVGDTDTSLYAELGHTGGITLYEKVDGSDSTLGITSACEGLPCDYILAVATNGADTDISVSINATTYLNDTYDVNAAIQGNNGYGGLYGRISRDCSVVVDDLTFTNDDCPAPSTSILPHMMQYGLTNG